MLGSLSGDAAGEFKFVPDWPEFDDEKRLELYTKHACHELNFFLMKKDPEFFRAVVVTHIRNKRDQTFMDHYLLGDNLAEFLEPWSYSRLNTVERILLAQRIEEQTQNISRNIEEALPVEPDTRGDVWILL